MNNLDEKFVDEVPAIRRRKGCLVCNKTFIQLWQGQSICEECLEKGENLLAEQDAKTEIAKDMEAEDIIEGANSLEEAEEELEDIIN